MMNKAIIIALSVLIIFGSCTKNSSPANQLLVTGGIAAVGPYLTQDHRGIPVLCWTEQNGKDSLNTLKYASYDLEKEAFGPAIAVPASIGCSGSAESMAKIAFKADGSVIALFAKRFAAEKNPYAGAIYYSQSVDAGKHWSAAKFLHSDTSHAYGRSFFDIARLKNGELAAIWLDGRFGKTIKGSALFYSYTVKGKGFEKDTCLDKGTCECCRTDILTDDAGNIHLAYRSISFPDPLAGKQVRDMVYKLSADNGKTFSPARPISKDNWEIEGCPHSGPTLAVVKNSLHAIWFTAGGSTGLYSTQANIGADFAQRKLITAEGRHPQMIALADGQTAMVCEEATVAEPEHHMKMDHSKHNGMMMQHGPAAVAKIVLRILSADQKIRTVDVSNGQHPDHHAVLTVAGKQVLIAWVRDDPKGGQLCYATIKP
jgi:hypothetical protein